ncbi:MAG: hypothetical protein IPN95_25080 [Bacteroidetes bacterium]|jgi:hypothetical protein|nr:hypothetical protein [Bacteroidota bacterium]MBP6721367.1 hypothetical protein [Bacteroidia bacterium]
MSPLDDRERKRLIDKIKTLQANYAMLQYNLAVGLVKDQIKERTEKLEEQAKTQREFIVDLVVCFIPLPKVVKTAIASEAVVDNIRSAGQELIKHVTKEYVLSDDENKKLEDLSNYASVMALLFNEKMFRLYDFLDLNALNRKTLPDELVSAVHEKFLPANWNEAGLAKNIQKHLDVMVKYSEDYGRDLADRDAIIDRSYDTRQDKMIVLKPILNFLPNGEIAYMPVYCFRHLQRYYQSGKVVAGDFLVYYNLIPFCFLDLAVQSSKKRQCLVIGDKAIDFRSNTFYEDLYGLLEGTKYRSDKFLRNHFKKSLFREVHSTFWGLPFTNYEQIKFEDLPNFTIENLSEY